MADYNMVKSTINISVNNFNSLKELVSTKEIGSMTEGINLGIEMLIKEKRRESYAKQMEAAARDKEFLKRTLEVQKEFDKIDTGVSEEW